MLSTMRLMLFFDGRNPKYALPVRAIHHLGDGYHLEQGGDLTWRVALRELVMEFSHLRQWTIGEMRSLTLHGETDEAAGEEWQRAAAVGEYPPDVGIFRARSAEDEMGNGARGIGGVFDR